MNKPSPKAVFIGIGERVTRTIIIAKLNVKNAIPCIHISLSPAILSTFYLLNIVVIVN